MKKLLVTAALIVLASACSDEAEPAGTARLRVVHAAPDAPAVDLYLAGVATPVVRGLAYGAASGYLEVAPGAVAVEVRPAGAPASSAPVHVTPSLTLAPDARVTAIAAGLLGSTDPGDRFRVLALAEEFGAPAGGNARVRVVHAGADAPAVAVDVGNDGSPEVAELARFADTGAGGIDLPARSLAIGLWAGSPLARVTAFTTPALPAGGELFVIATGRVAAHPAAADGFVLLAVGPGGVIGGIRQDPTIHALHASPDAPAVDIFAGDAELVDDLRPGALSGALQVPPGTYTLDFFAHAAGAGRPAGSPAASASTPELAAGQRYLAIATGFLGDEPGFQLLAFADELQDGGAGARLRVVHASPDTPAVDVGTMSGAALSPVWSDLGFREASEAAGTAVPAGELDVGVGLAGTGEAAFTFGVTAGAGTRAFVIAAGSLAAETVRLIVVDASGFPWTAAEVPPR
jgi:hypothetical protein